MYTDSFTLNIKEDEDKIELFGTKGGVSLSPELEIYNEINDYLTNVSFYSDTSMDFDKIFQNEINHFVVCVQERKECIAPAVDGVDLMAILDAVYESVKTGREVIL